MPAPVLLVRHGESEWNVARRTQGQTTHPPLTDRGLDQASVAATTVARLLSERRPRTASVVSSDLVRARQTADVVARRLGLGVREDARLREMALGALEGLGYEETWRVGEEHDWSDPDLPVAGGESPSQVRTRMAAVVREAMVEAAGGTAVVLVTHGDAIRYAAEGFRPVATGQGEWLEVPNGAVFLVDGGLTRIE